MPFDKQLHIIYSFALALAGALIFGVAKGIVLALAIGASKELIYDWLLGRGNPDWWDMVANCVGVGLAVLVLKGGGMI